MKTINNSFKAFAIWLLLVTGLYAQSAATPKLDLKVRHVRSEDKFSGWRFEVINNDQQSVNLSDLEVRFWVHGKGVVEAKTWNPGSVEDADGNNFGMVSGLTANVEHMKRFTVYPANEKAEWLVGLKAQSLLTLPAGGRWKNAYFEYYLKNWGLIEADQSYSQSPIAGSGKEYFENSTVGLYYQGNLVSEWESASQPDNQTGKEPLAPLTVPTVVANPSHIASPNDGEQVCGIVQIAVKPQSNDWQLEWSADGTSWQTINTQDTGSYWLASWDVRGLRAGSYQLRLQNDQNNSTLQQITVTVSNPQFSQSYLLSNKGVPGGLGLNGSNLNVLDFQNQLVQVFSSTGSPLQTIGSYGTRSGELNQAYDLAIDGSGELYVADTGNQRVQILSPTTGLLGETILNHPVAVKAYPTGLFVLDGPALNCFDVNGNYLYSGWLGWSGQYADAAVDNSGNAYILNNKNQTIDIYGPDFVKKTSWNGPFGAWNPSAIYYSNGRIWVTDSQANQVLKLGLDGNCLASWGGYGPAQGQFDQPGKVLADASGNVYVSDTGNNRVEKFVLQTAAQVTATVTASPNTSGLMITGFSASPSSFNPSQGQATFTYSLSQAAQVQESIQDGSGNILLRQIYTAGDFGGQSGLNRIYWSGLSNGNSVPGGSYTVNLVVSANGQEAQAQAVVYLVGLNTSVPTSTNTAVVIVATATPTSPIALPTAIVTATPTSPVILPTLIPTETPTKTPVPPTATPTNTPVPPTPTFTPTPVPLSIGGFSISPSTIDRLHGPADVNISFTLSVSASMTLQLKNSSGSAVFSAAFSGQDGSNTYTYIYQGVSNSSKQLPAGTYTFVLMGTSSGGATESAQGNLTITP
jgi:hypothetical protein